MRLQIGIFVEYGCLRQL